MMDRTVFITNSSACLNLRASDLKAPPLLRWFQSDKFSFLRGLYRLWGEWPPDSSASYYVPKLSVYTEDVLMDRNVAVQGHGVRGCWRNFFQRLPDIQNSLFITAVMSGVMLLGPGWKLRCSCVIYKLHMCVFSLETTLGLCKRSLILFWLTSAPKVGSQQLVWSQNFTPGQVCHLLGLLAQDYCSSMIMWPKVLENTNKWQNQWLDDPNWLELLG